MQGCDIMIAKDFIQKEHFMGERMDGCLSWELGIPKVFSSAKTLQSKLLALCKP